VEVLPVAALGALVLLAVAARLVAALAGRLAAAARRSGRAAASAGGALGVRGLLLALAGTATTAAGSVATVGAAAASPSPVASPARHATAPTARASAQPATYVVRPGDSLWAIAARHLGPGASDAAVAAEWPRWYRANHAVIGSNPSLLHVGTRLAVPHGRRTGTSASPHSTPAPSGPDRTALSLDPDRR
jgi:nucleoid-associated protein YgaU